MKVYVAGPMFTPAERTYLDGLADRLEEEGHVCFVPHRQVIEPLDATTVFAADSAGLHAAEALVAWLDGPMIDDGTACEIGIFSELVRTTPARHRGMVGLATDWRAWRRRDRGMTDGGVNLFVGGAILEHGCFAWSIDDAVEALRAWS
jgi:nucleoside 2-deoxyribosyltransferase